MFALIAAIILFLAAFGVHAGTVNLVWLALGFWALHFAWGFIPWSDWRRSPGPTP
jgi:hypothetical protein